ncbi:MAG: exodeoxyribonuclease VII large subunit [Proteobacteria bacterium]|nr:exodeoxyribonuclease VII large subunit [Pseudomonadota bacterium]
MRTSIRPVLRKIHTVRELTHMIREKIEESFPYVWVTGEVSEMKQPVSGHLYFTFKDESARIRAVMFKGHFQKLKFALEDGLSVIALGRVSVYEARGDYQLLVEHLEHAGTGVLALAFEQLKKKFSDEGLFDEKQKQPLPFIPRKIAVVTSPTGAVIHDILHILERRFPHVHVQIVPVKVQGSEAAGEIVRALEFLNQLGQADIIILARGGGSLEDLAPFNAEAVGRAVFASKIPLISAVGHETDYTIADFCADVRAPTPTAAAQMAVPERDALLASVSSLTRQLGQAWDRLIQGRRKNLDDFSRRLRHPGRQVQDRLLRVDDLSFRLDGAMGRDLKFRRERLARIKDRLHGFSPRKALENRKVLVERNREKLQHAMAKRMAQEQSRMEQSSARLAALSPLAVLARGYSITRIPDTGEVVRYADQAGPRTLVDVLLHQGTLKCRVEESKGDPVKS